MRVVRLRVKKFFSLSDWGRGQLRVNIFWTHPRFNIFCNLEYSTTGWLSWLLIMGVKSRVAKGQQHWSDLVLLGQFWRSHDFGSIVLLHYRDYNKPLWGSSLTNQKFMEGNTGIFHWSWDEWILLLVKSFVEWLLDFRNGWNCYLQLFFLESIVPTISVFRTDKKLAKILHHQPKNMKQTVPDGWNCQNIKTLSPFWCLTKDQPTDTSNFFGWAMGPVKAIISIAYSHYTP